MEFEYDSTKSERNREQRGFDFAFATRVFEGRTVEMEDDRVDSGEVRIVAIGEIDGRLTRSSIPTETRPAGSSRPIAPADRR